MMKLFYTLLVVIFLSVTAFAQWSTDPATNTAICTSTNDQEEVVIATDEQGGAIMTWRDYRNNSGIFEGDIYAQRINSIGKICWQIDGIVVNNQPNGQFRPQIISDGEGGAIVVWAANQGGFYNYNLYAQRIDSLGNLLWTASGVPIAVGPATDSFQEIIPDGNGGAIIVWQRLPNIGSQTDIYAQKVNASGTVQWTANGVAICLAAQSQSNPKLVGDSNGGAIIVWQDSRAGMPNTNIYAQRIDSNGNVMWANDGIPICTDSATQSIPEICTDEDSGAIIVWEDYRASGSAIYAQRIDVSGKAQWSADGIQISPSSEGYVEPLVCSDGENGAIIVWKIERLIMESDIGAQRIDDTGSILWGENGVNVCLASGNQEEISIMQNDAGGVIVTWQDFRNNASGDVYTQWIDRNGTTKWKENGVEICTATDAQHYPVLTTDLLAGAIIAWSDERNGVDANVYAQNIDYRGVLGTERFFYQRSGLGIAFNDTQPASDTLNIGSTGLAKYQQPFDLSIRIDEVIHDYVSDLEFTLTHLSVFDTLIYRVDGGGGVNFINTVLNDNLGIPFANSSAPFTGFFRPYNPLASFMSTPASGEWILTITDHKAGDDGVFDGWSLIISQSTIVNIIEEENEIPNGFALYQNYPNPFNPTTEISWQSAFNSMVTIEIYNLRGQKVRSLIHQTFPAGLHSVRFDGTGLASGIYFYSIKAGDFVAVKKMILMK
jgi:hypothetical protein